MAVRQITGTFYKPGGNTPWASGTLTIRLRTDYGVAGGIVYPQNEYVITLDGNGAIPGSTYLATPGSGDGAWLYECELPNGKVFHFTLSYGLAAYDLSAAIDDLTGTVTSTAVSALLSSYSTLGQTMVPFDTIASMKATALALTSGQLVGVSSLTQGGLFKYDAALAAFDTGEGVDIDAANVAGGFSRLDRRTISVDWWGNDSAAFGNAITYLKSKGQGRLTLNPETAYLIDARSISQANNIILDGNGARIKLNNANNEALFTLSDCRNFRFINCWFYGTSDEDGGIYNASFSKGGLNFGDGCTFCLVERCFFERFTSYCIRATNQDGETFTKGIRIVNNWFFNCPYDAATNNQAAIFLTGNTAGGADDTEYSQVIANWFYQVPCAIRASNAANSTIALNHVLNPTGPATLPSDTDPTSVNRAVFWFQFNSNNGGKWKFQGNTVNHVEVGTYPLYMEGDPAAGQNGVTITGNHFLANALPNDIGTYDNFQVILKGLGESLVADNDFRSANNKVTGLVYLDGCGDVVFRGNDFRFAGRGIRANGVLSGYTYSAVVQDNAWAALGADNAPTRWVETTGGGTFRAQKNRTLLARIGSDGVIDAAVDDDFALMGFTVASFNPHPPRRTDAARLAAHTPTDTEERR